MEQTITQRRTATDTTELDSFDWQSVWASVLSFLGILWTGLRRVFWSASARLSSQFAPALDIDRIARRLGIVKRAETDGVQELPSCREELPSGTQREIIVYFTNLRRQAQRQVVATIDKANSQLEKIRMTEALTRIRDIPAACEKECLRLLADSESRLDVAREAAQRQQQHYDAFRGKNGLERAADYPAWKFRNHFIALILMVAVAAGLASVFAIDTGSTAGISFVWLGAVTAIIVVVPFLLGEISVRAMLHVSGVNNFFGLVGTLASIVMIFALAYYVDYYLAALQQNSLLSQQALLDTMLVAPVDIVSGIASWEAFALVALAGLLALMLGYRSDDPYPGYGDVQRKYFLARDTSLAMAADLGRRINTMIDQSESATVKAAEIVKAGIRKYTKTIHKSQRMASALDDYDGQLEEACNLVLDRYRTVNSAVRRTDTPMSFSEHVCFNPADDSELRRRVGQSDHVAELQEKAVELDKAVTLTRENLRALNLRMTSTLAESVAEERPE